MAGAGRADAVASFTPGPWRVEKPEDDLIKFSIQCIGDRPTVEIWADGKHAAGGFYHPIALVADNDHANARLIAAAPDMLAALQEIRSLLMAEDVSPLAAIENALVPLDAAIAKATGAA